MGAFAVNLHVRTVDTAAVQRQVEAAGATDFRIAEPLRGWTTVYERRISDQDDTRIKELASDLSRGLDAACAAFLLHDSDIACYWLYDHGQLLDEFNSAPDYFEDASAEERRRVRGRPEVFQRYCRPGVTTDQIESVMRTSVIFADDIVSQLAEFLGIDPQRALADFRHGGGPDGGFDDDDDGPAGFDPRSTGGLARQMQQQYASMFAAMTGEAATPFGDEMVQAAAAGNVAEIDRLIASGADANAVGSMPVPTAPTDVTSHSFIPPGIRLSALFAAAFGGRVEAVRRLIALGAKPQEVHPLMGTPLHAAVRAGSPEIVEILLAAGVSANVQNTQGQSPLAFLQSLRQAFASIQATILNLPPQFRDAYNQRLASAPGFEMPVAGWDACEKLLREVGGR